MDGKRNIFSFFKKKKKKKTKQKKINNLNFIIFLSLSGSFKHLLDIQRLFWKHIQKNNFKLL